MAAGFKMQVDGLEAALLGLSHAQKTLKEETAPILGEIAKDIRLRARKNVNVAHPYNFFKSNGSRLTPSYRTKQAGSFWWVVQTPSSAAGAREAQAEFAASGHTPQGRALVSALTSVYGRSGAAGNGRILYKVRDEIDAEAAAKLNDGVAKAAAKIEKEINRG